jgi:hypothetical protein
MMTTGIDTIQSFETFAVTSSKPALHDGERQKELMFLFSLSYEVGHVSTRD